MKRIIYKKAGRVTKYDPKTMTEEFSEILVEVNVEYTEANEAIAKAEAYKGEYTIEDDGQPESETTDDVLNALLGVTV